MWTEWSPMVFDKDMTRTARVGATTVRLIVFPEVFGYPTPTPDMARRLESAIGIAEQRGLTVQLTLFDAWDDYSDLEGSRTWTTALLSGYRDDPRISFVEVRNEIDASNAQAMAWAQDQIRLLHQLMPFTPVTISTDSATEVAGLVQLQQALASDPPDLYSLHYYGSPVLAYDTFRQAAAAVAPAPLVIGEAGYSTSREEPAFTGKDVREGDQAAWYRVVQRAAHDAGLAPFAPWTLYDFVPEGIPSEADADEHGYGLLRPDGSPKPAASVQSEAFAGTLDAGPYSGDFGDPKDEAERAAGWTQWMPSGSARVEVEEGVRGENALVFSGTVWQEGGVTGWYTVPAEPVRPGETWTVTVHARGTDASGNNDVALAWYDGDGAWLGNTTSDPLRPDVPGWQVLVARGAAPAEARGVTIHLRSEGNDGEVAFSQVRWTVAASTSGGR
jgi:hypothetical protein